MIIDHSSIDPEMLSAVCGMAKLVDDHMALSYPWLPGYPSEGQAVYYDRRLWTVVGLETGPGADEPTALAKLVGNQDGLYAERVAVRYEIRPVTWTQDDEDWVGRE